MRLTRKEFRWILWLTLILVVGLLIASNWHLAIHKNDPTQYAQRTHLMLDGKLPYVDFQFEHLPVSIAPMLVAGLLEKALGSVNYTLLFWAVMGCIVFGVGIALNGLGRRVGVDDAALRWVKISWALLPLAAFRVDAFSILLTLVALNLAIDGDDRASAWAMGFAIAAKGWPISLVVVDWWRGKRLRAIITTAATLAGAAVLLSLPLFRSGRDFFGVHMETVTGAATAFWRGLRGSPLQSDLTAGATYIEVGTWALLVNAGLGIALGVSALRGLRNPFHWRRAPDLVGVMAIALMLLSPLLSAQFILWITPFAALSSSRRVQTGTMVTALLTGVFITFWYFDSTWWWGIIVVRNLALLWTGWVWSQHLSKPIPADIAAVSV